MLGDPPPVASRAGMEERRWRRRWKARASRIDTDALKDRVTPGTLVTLMAADRLAMRRNDAAVAPRHLLLALLERPERRIRELLERHGARTGALCDELTSSLLAMSPIVAVEPPLDLPTVLSSALAAAKVQGASRVDDLSLFGAIVQGGDWTTRRVLAEAGVTIESVCDAARGTAPDASAPVWIGSVRPARTATPAPAWQPPQTLPLWCRNLGPLRKATKPSPLFATIVSAYACSFLLLAIDPGARFVRPFTVAFRVLGWFVSRCLHEYGHAAAAFLAGDTDVQTAGYLTLDPRRYTHPVMSFILPLLSVLLGSIPLPGRAVRINDWVVRSCRTSQCISLAGPAANLLSLVAPALLLTLGVDRFSPFRRRPRSRRPC
ncbi:MAG: Clp protease N-terminal domain-containing protein [Thermomicrobiales bacterium]